MQSMVNFSCLFEHSLGVLYSKEDEHEGVVVGRVAEFTREWSDVSLIVESSDLIERIIEDDTASCFVSGKQKYLDEVHFSEVCYNSSQYTFFHGNHKSDFKGSWRLAIPF